jgi:hypothetical protein
MGKKKTERDMWQIRCAQAEKALEDCSAAFELIPIWALEREQNWLPSAVALHLLKTAKDSVQNYSTAHWHTGNGS